MNLKTIVCVGLLLSALSLKAQYWDYVVTTKGDTIKCTINKSRTRYKTADVKRSKEIIFGEIGSYYSTEVSALYRAIVEPGENDEDSTVYAEVVEKGSINLYRVPEREIDESPPLYKPGTIPVGGNSSHVRQVYSWYIQKGTGRIKTIRLDSWGNERASKRNAVFAEMIKDNKDIYNQYASANKLSIDAIMELIREYNKAAH